MFVVQWNRSAGACPVYCMTWEAFASNSDRRLNRGCVAQAERASDVVHHTNFQAAGERDIQSVAAAPTVAAQESIAVVDDELTEEI